MDYNTKVALLVNHNPFIFESELNQSIQLIESEGGTILNIKYSIMATATESAHSCLLVYTVPKN
jgi:hypothetical protein